jgi:hypothetical protein
MHDIKRLIENYKSNSTNSKELVIKIHDYVRDKVRFGFTRKFDLASPTYTLETGYGHANSKGALFVKLLKDAGIKAQLHFVTISKSFLEGALPPVLFHLLPDEITQSYTEVNINGNTFKVDSYTIDKALHNALLLKLSEEGKHRGYGTFISTSCDWDGASNNFVQFHSDMLLEDHGNFDNPEDYYFHNTSYKHQFIGIQFSYLLEYSSLVFAKNFEVWANSILNHYRMVR